MSFSSAVNVSQSNFFFCYLIRSINFLFCAASTKLQLSFGQPDFVQHPVEDLFRGLGPLTLFSAKHKWNPPRLAHLRKLHDQGFGFSVRGDGPIIIAGVDGGSIADVIQIGFFF